VIVIQVGAALDVFETSPQAASRSRTHQMEHNRGQLPPVRCQAASGLAAQGQADGLYRSSGRIPRRREDTQSIIMSPGAEVVPDLALTVCLLAVPAGPRIGEPGGRVRAEMPDDDVVAAKVMRDCHALMSLTWGFSCPGQT